MKNVLWFSIIVLLTFTTNICLISCDDKESRIENNEDEKDIEQPIAISIELISGGNQASDGLSSLQQPIIVIVKDEEGNGLPGYKVQVSVSEGGISSAPRMIPFETLYNDLKRIGNITVDSVITDYNGKASIWWKLGATVGSQSLIITAKNKNNKSLFNSPLNVTATATAIMETISDYEGNSYPTVIIGNQLWMAKNLASTKYNDGVSISNTSFCGSSGAYCYLENNIGNANTYGVLYNWHAVKTGKLCPQGWHIPTDNEWAILEMHLGMSQSEVKENGRRGTNQGCMIAGNASLWGNEEYTSNNVFGKSGLNVLPSGEYNCYEKKFYAGNSAQFWTSTLLRADYDIPLQRGISTLYTGISAGSYGDRGFGLAVRCIRD